MAEGTKDVSSDLQQRTGIKPGDKVLIVNSDTGALQYVYIIEIGTGGEGSSDLQTLTNLGAQTNNVIGVSGNLVPNSFTGKGIYLSDDGTRGLLDSFDFDDNEGKLLVLNPNLGRVLIGASNDDGNNSLQTEGGIRSNGFLSGIDGFRAGGNNLSYGIFAVSGNYNHQVLHAFDDYSVATATNNGQGYSSFDASRILKGGFNQDHMIGYQARSTYEGTGAITGVYGITGFFNHTTHNGSGIVSRHQGVWIDDISGTGIVYRSTGIHIQDINRGSVDNYAIYTNAGKIRFGDLMDAPTVQSRNIFATENENKFNTQKSVYLSLEEGKGKLNAYDFATNAPIPLILNELGGATRVPTAPVGVTDVARLNEVILSTSKQTGIGTTAAGAFNVTIPVLINQFVNFVVKSGIVYKVGTTANETDKIVSFNSSTGTITFASAFTGSEKIWADYRGITGGTTQSNIVIVQNYSDIMGHSTWGGSSKVEYYVLTDNQNMGGKKGAYKYIPGFTTTPAQIAINFND